MAGSNAARQPRHRVRGRTGAQSRAAHARRNPRLLDRRPARAGGDGVSEADDLHLALEMAELADSLTLPRFRDIDLAIDTKPDLTPVTEVDRGVEWALRELVSERRPGDAVVGEEYGATGDSTRRWIVDPVDGTKNFVRGLPVWASLIALEDAGEIVVGVASAPALGRRWWAAQGLGAFADGEPIGVSVVSS